MSKGRKRSKAKAAAKAAKAAAKAAGFGMLSGPRPPPPGGFCGVGPPRPVPYLGPMIPEDQFSMGPPDFAPPMMRDEPFINDPPEFLRRDRHEHRPEFNPQEFEMHPRFPYPDLEVGPRGFHSGRYMGRHGFHPSEFERGPSGFVPPELRDGPPGFRDEPPGFVPPEFRDRPPGFVPHEFRDESPGFVPHEFRDESPGFVPPEFRDRPPGFVPPEFRDRPPGFVPPEFRDESPGFVPPEFRDRPPGFVPPEFRDRLSGFVPPAGNRPSKFEDGPGYPVINPGCGTVDVYMDLDYRQSLDANRKASCPPEKTQLATEQSSCPSNNKTSKDSTTTTTATATAKKEMSVVRSMLGSVKPPPGRSMGIITFVANNYGFIEREDQKNYSFSFDAFFGKRNHLLPGVKVHFTAVKESGKECATDVKVAPGGTEEIEATVYEGVVTTVLPDTYVLEPYPGCIRSILTTETVKLPFGKMDSKATLLLFDRVTFQLLTDIITKFRRATNITPQMPETFQLTKEIREKGVVMNIKDDALTIMSKTHENLTTSLSEFLSDDQLQVMDEVEFTLLNIKDKPKAIRLKKLPEGSVEFAKKVTDPFASKSVLQPETSKEPAVEDISSEKYEGTVFQIVPKSFQNKVGQQPQGLVNTTVDGTQKSLPFGSDDVITQATMMVGDKVQFNVATKQQTKEERAVNIEIQPETFQQESTEQRKIGIVVKLNDNSGFIKAPQDPQLFFDLSEVMDDAKLTLSEKVEFTLAVGSEGAPVNKQAIRIRRLTQSVFTSVPKIEEKKEKKKMTIKLLKDPKEQIKKQVTDGDLLAAEKLGREKVDNSKAPKPDIRGKQEKLIKSCKERSRSPESSRRGSSRSSSRGRDRSGSHYGSHRSSSRDISHRSYRRSRSCSRDRSRRYRRSYSHSRSRSRSRERSSRSGRKRSHSPENIEEHRRGQSNNKECRSRSPDGQNKTSKYATYSSDFTNTASPEAVHDELTKKRKELLELNELIARKKAIIAMEQNTKTPSQFKEALEIEGQLGIATFDYQHKTCPENSWTPNMKPVRSILKKHSDSFTSLQNQKSERSESPEEPVGCPKTSTSSISMSAGSVPAWIKQSSTREMEDQELARKKRQLAELSECIARKRAIMAMEQKAKALCDGSEIKKNYDFASCSDDPDMTITSKNTWQLDIKPDLQPKKSILKKRSESVTDQPQKDLTSDGQYARFPVSKQHKDNQSAFPSPSGPSDTAFKKPCNPPSVFSNTVELFKKLINDASASSRTGNSKAIAQPSFQSSSGLLHDPKNTRETKDSTLPSQISQIFHQDCEQASTGAGSTTQFSASTRQSNLATQMERFLGALNKADSNLLSSLLRDSKKDSASMENQRISQEQPERKVSCGDELYDPFKETDCGEDNYPSMGSKGNINPMLGHIENPQDDLLPHERAVVDGSGFSKIVGMRYGSEVKPENRFLYGEAIPSSSQSRLSEENKCDKYKLSQDHYSNKPYFKDSYTEDKESYRRQKPSESYRVESSLSPVHHKSEDVDEDVDQKASQLKKIQDLLQTIGLNLDTTEVSKLADRTKERLYGKKVKPQRSHSSDQKDERSLRRYDRRGSSQSTDSEDVNSVSPAKTSKREVYMSYLDTIKYRHDEVAVKEQDLFSLKRTVRNSPEAKQVTSEPYKVAPAEVVHESYTSVSEAFSSAQSAGLQYTQMSSEFSSDAHHPETKHNSWECSYASAGEQNPYGSVTLNPLHYATGYSTLPPHLPHGYENYTASAGPTSTMPPSPAHFYPPPPIFTAPGPFGPTPPPYPPPPGHFGFAMQPSSFGYATQQAKSKPTTQNRCLKTIETVQIQKSVSVNPSVFKEVRTVISIKTEEEPKDAEGKTENPAASLMEDDIKAKQKKRLEQFNQRMRLKKEQQMEAQRTRGLSQKSAPGKVIRTEVKNVWICGHSLVFWAEKRATSPEIGMQLGMDPNSVRIWWKGVQGMTWQQLLPQLLQLKDHWPEPDVIVMHLGGNDIGTMTPDAFVLAVKKDLVSLKSIFPQCHLVWSDILPRKSWRHSDDNTAVNNMRQAINKTIEGIMAELGGSSLTHDNIMPQLDSALYRPDGVHLSGKGIDTFNLNMQDFLEKWESEISETETSES